MDRLSSRERQYLKALAHKLEPLVFVGKKGITDTLTSSLDDALVAHELVKVKFNEHKDQKKVLADVIAERAQSQVVGIVGNVATFYRPQEDEEKRRIDLSRA